MKKTETATATLTRFRGTCNSARYASPYGNRKSCAKVVRFWSAFGILNAKVGLVDNHSCPDCGHLVYGRPVKVRKVEKVCTADCYNAKSANCACSCEGDNHGKAHEGRGILL